MRWTVGAKLGLGFGLALAILLVIGIASYLGTRTLMEAYDREIHTHLVLEKLENVLSLLKDTETGQRGYIITGQERYLEPYDQAFKQIASEMKGIRELTADNADQQVRLDALALLIMAKLAELKETIDLRRTEGFEATRQLVLTEKGKIIMDKIRNVIGDMKNGESLLLEEQKDKAEASARSTTRIIVGGTLSAFLLLSVAVFLITQNITKPLREIAKVSEGVASGDFSLKVQNYARSDEVGILADSFRNMMERRKQAEKELARLAAFPTQNPGPVVECDAEGLVSYVNPAFEHLLNEELLDTPQRLCEQLFPRFRELIKRSLEDNTQAPKLETQHEARTLLWTFHPVPTVGRVHLYAMDITERKRAEEALTTSEERYRNIFESSNDAIFVLDAEVKHLLDANQNACTLVGYSREELLQTPPSSLHRDEMPQFRAFMKTVLEKGSGRTEELTCLHKSGRCIPAEISASTFTSAEGRPIIIALVRDITERKRAEEALQESEQRFRALFEKVPAGLYRSTPDGRILDANPALVKMLGYASFEELAAQNLEEGGYGQGYSRREFKQRIEQEGEVKNQEAIWLRQDRSEIIVRENARVIHDANGAVLHYQGSVEDITERKRVEEALRRSEAEFRSLFEHAPYGIYRSSLEGRFLTVNPALVEMLGYDSGEELLAVNMATDIYQDPGERARLLMHYKDGLEGLEVQWKRKSGRPILVRLSDRSVRDEPSGICYFEAMVEDITEQRSLEDQLGQASKMEAVGQLAGGVAHDFNNMLMVIRGYNELLLDKLEQGNPLRRNAEEVQQAADRAAALTQQLLAFSRKQVLQTKALDLNAIVVEMDKLVRRLVGEGIERVTLMKPGLGRVRGDRGQIEQIILNLAVNARHAMPQGGKLIIETSNVELDEAYVGRRMVVKPGHYVMLAVSDNGVGMDAETQSRIFEPFFTTRERGTGTGLGLATVYGIVKQSGGYIWVYSEPGQGTTFKIYLPRTEETVEAAKPKEASAPPLRGSETILVVEDEMSVRRLTREFLQGFGYDVLEAIEGHEALRVAEQHKGPVHLLLTDVVMPGMNGNELAQRLRPLRPEMMVLYMSGYTDDSIIPHGILDSDVAFLQKPFTLETLARKVRHVLEVGRRDDSPV